MQRMPLVTLQCLCEGGGDGPKAGVIRVEHNAVQQSALPRRRRQLAGREGQVGRRPPARHSFNGDQLKAEWR